MATGKAPIDWGGAKCWRWERSCWKARQSGLPARIAQRGTFSHRHASLRDYEKGEKYVPLANISDNQAPIHHREHDAVGAGGAGI